MRTLALTLLLLAGSAAAARADVRWTLDLESVRVDSVTLHGVEGPGNYVYWIIKVKNDNGEDVPVKLGIEAETDIVDKTYRATYDPIVKKAVERKMGRKFKTLSEARKEPLADGEEIEIFVTLGKVDPNVDRLDFVVAGLKDRVYFDRYKAWVQDDLRLLTFVRKGDEFLRQHDLFTAKGDRWITRKERQELRRGR